MSLSYRLRKALTYVEDHAVVMDIGADHGLFSMELSHSHKVYATENKKGPYQHLSDSLKGTSVIPLFQDGIEKIPDDVDTLCLLGMGGKTIEKIFASHPENLSHVQTLILEPQSDFSRPITYLLEHGYHNDLGTYVLEKRYYPLLRFKKGKETYNPREAYFGPYPLRHHDCVLGEFLVSEIKRYESLGESGKEAHQAWREFLKEAKDEFDFSFESSR